MLDFTNPTVFLSVLIFLPAVVALVIAFLPFSGETIKRISLGATIVVFFMSLCMIFGWSDVQYKLAETGMQNTFSVPWIPAFNINYFMGTDGISFPLVALTALVSMFAMGASWPI